MKKAAFVLPALSLIASFTLFSCSSFTEVLLEGGREGAEQALYEQAEVGIYKALAPKEEVPPPASPQWGQFMAVQAQVVFSYTFSAGGLWPGEAAYKVGEYTTFEFKPREDDPATMERAFLKQLDNGNQWWRVAWNDGEDSYVYEGLLSPQEQRLLRLRARDPDGNEGEVPVSGQAIYMPPAEVGEESLKGATVGSERLTTPAGTFQTDHAVFMAMGSEIEVEWWIADQVPGGVVKYLAREQKDGKIVWTATLVETGGNAGTVLSSF